MIVLTVLAVAAALAAFASTARAPAATAADRAAGCPASSDAGALPRRPGGGGRLRGDIDGDGYSDSVSIRYALNAPASCGFLLVVKTGRRELAVRVPEMYKAQDRTVKEWPWREPFVAAVVRLAPHREQVVVAREEGASVVEVSIYGIAGRSLVPLSFHPALYRNELSLFGTAGTGSTNVHCVPGGPMIVLGVAPTSATAKQLAFTQTVYRLGRDGFSSTRTHRVVGTGAHISALAHRSGFDALPFTGCTLARGRRL
jgi:hypothetical protein